MIDITLQSINQQAPHIFSFHFESERLVDYQAGQFTEIFLLHQNADDRGIKRWFTLSSSPTERGLTITTKMATDRPSTFKQTLMSLTPGTRIRAAQPMGDFVLPIDTSIPLVFFAGGMGITPFRSIIKYVQDTQQKREILLIHSVRVEEDLVFTDLFKNAPITYLPVVTSPKPHWQGEAGRMDPQRIIKFAEGKKDKLFFIAGPEPMTEMFVKVFPSLGVPAEQLVTDYFPGYPDI